jgi:hypothetical protein
MTRKSKISDKPDTQGAKDSLEGNPPEEAKAPITADPQQAAAQAEADGTIPSATPSDAEGGSGGGDVTPPEQAEAPITVDPQQAAAPAEADGTIPSATSSDAESGAGGGDVTPPEQAGAPITADPDAEDQANMPEATITVTCHSEAGRRRAGRRWEFGDNTVPLDSLTDYQLAQLRGDPLFTVKG